MCRGSFSLGSITRRMQNLIIKSSKQQVEWMVASATAVCSQTRGCSREGSSAWSGVWCLLSLPGLGEAGLWLWLLRVQVTRGVWEALLHTCVSSARGERLRRCPFCRGGLFPWHERAGDTKAAMLPLPGVRSHSQSGPLVGI